MKYQEEEEDAAATAAAALAVRPNEANDFLKERNGKEIIFNKQKQKL